MGNNFNKQFGSRLKELRTIANISQEELAEAVGVSPQTVSYWENGHNPVTFGKLPIIAKALNIPVYRLFIFPDFKANKDFLNTLETIDSNKLNAILDILRIIESIK